VPGEKNLFGHRKKESKPRPPVTALSNLLFLASLMLTLVSFLCGEKMPLWLGATLSAILLVARIVSDRIAAKRQLALRPVTVTRLDY